MDVVAVEPDEKASIKIDVVRAFEDEELAAEFGIPARKVYSGDLCPDHAGVMVMRDAIAWAVLDLSGPWRLAFTTRAAFLHAT